MRVDYWAELASAYDGSVRLFGHVFYEAATFVLVDRTASVIDGKPNAPKDLITSSKMPYDAIVRRPLCLDDVLQEIGACAA